MAYPRPIEFESQERLYKQAVFFYDEYERMKEKNNRLHEAINTALGESHDHCLFVGDPVQRMRDVLRAALKEGK